MPVAQEQRSLRPRIESIRPSVYKSVMDLRVIRKYKSVSEKNGDGQVKRRRKRRKVDPKEKTARSAKPISVEPLPEPPNPEPKPEQLVCEHCGDSLGLAKRTSSCQTCQLVKRLVEMPDLLKKIQRHDSLQPTNKHSIFCHFCRKAEAFTQKTLPQQQLLACSSCSLSWHVPCLPRWFNLASGPPFTCPAHIQAPPALEVQKKEPVKRKSTRPDPSYIVTDRVFKQQSSSKDLDALRYPRWARIPANILSYYANIHRHLNTLRTQSVETCALEAFDGP